MYMIWSQFRCKRPISGPGPTSYWQELVMYKPTLRQAREIFTCQFLLKNGNDIMCGMWISNPYFRFPNFPQKWAVSGPPLIITVSLETLLTSVGLLFPPCPVFSAALCKLTISKVKMPGIALFSELLAVLCFCLLVCRTKCSTGDSG